MHPAISFITATLPVLAVILVACVTGFYLYMKVRSRFPITVNCWFCIKNTRVPFSERNHWTCPNCEQYNGFNKDGDYNRDILSQRDCSTLSRDSSSPDNSSGARSSHCANAFYGSELADQPPQENGLCSECNEAQRLKIEKLAQFEPRSESRFDQELKLYQNELEQRYRLCASCERHVNKVLHEKKKMVLGSKFLNFIMKGAALLKQPHFQRLARAQQQRRLARYGLLMKLLTALNILCLLYNLPTATPEKFKAVLGDLLAKPLYFVYSHVLTMLRLVVEYSSEVLAEQAYAVKPMLFVNTLGKMLIYSVGMSPNQAAQATFSSCFTSLYPYAMLALSFACSLTCGLKLTRYHGLTLLWSLYAKGSEQLLEHIVGVLVLLLGIVLTLVALSMRGSSPAFVHAEESFHRLCADECINDDETISLLSQQLSCNASSNASNSSCRSPQLRTPIPKISHTQPLSPNPTVTPSVLSLDSLRLSSQRTPMNAPSWATAAPVPTFRSQTPMYAASSLDQQAWRNNYALNVHMDSVWQRGGGNNYAESRQASYAFGLDQRPMTRSTHNLLLPSRLQMQHQQQERHGDISAWVNAASGHPQPELLQEPNTANLLQCSDNRLSRTSSQSSGFESQLGNNAQRQEVPQIWPPPPESQAPSGVVRDLGFPLRVPPGPASAFAATSEFGLGRRSAGPPEYRTGDLLRNWVDRVGARKSNAAPN